MLKVRTLKNPQKTIISIFLFLLAAFISMSPLNLSLEYRAALIVAISYLSFSTGGLAFAYLTALVAPLFGLIGGDLNWLIMLPIFLSSLFLAMLGLEYAWRYPAIIISPLLFAAPQIISYIMSKTDLFSVALPWEPAENWIKLQLLAAVAGSLLIVYIDRLRERQAKKQAETAK